MDTDNYGPKYKSQTDAMYRPQIIQLKENLSVAAFRLMKLVPARHVVMKAYREGRIDPKVGIVETSSGTYALALGLICAELQIPFHIVSDPAIDDSLRRRLEDLGGKVTIVSKDSSGANVQVLRLAVVHKHLEENPGAFWPCQYHNPDNRVAYKEFAEQLKHHYGDRFIFVGTVGSGGSTGGTAEIIRETSNDVKVVGIDTFGSVLFGLPNDRRVLRGLGNSLIPENLCHSQYDEVHWVTAEDAFFHTRRLHQQHAMFMGPTTGAAFQVADWVAKENKDQQVVFIAADEGYRYTDTVYNDAWLKSEGLYCTQSTRAPIQFDSIKKVTSTWARMPWGRRSLQDVVGQPDDNR